MVVRLGQGGFGPLLRVLLAALLLGGETGKAEALRREHGPHFGSLALEHGCHAATHIDVGVPVAHANMQREVATV